jgi:hypothetical protein
MMSYKKISPSQMNSVKEVGLPPQNSRILVYFENSWNSFKYHVFTFAGDGEGFPYSHWLLLTDEVRD